MAHPAISSITARTATYLRDSGAATVNEISRQLELSRTSVENAMTTLSERNIVVEGPAQTGKGAGRPARAYHFNAKAGVVVGVDVGIASVRVVASDLSGNIVLQRKFDGIADAEGGAAKLSAVISDVRIALNDGAVALSKLRAIGVGLPGIVDEVGHVVTSVVIPEWSGIDIGRQLRQAFDCPIALDNGVRLAAVAEHHLGVAQLVDDVLYVSVGHRIAMGLILGGRPRRGAHHVAGDIGRLAFRGLGDEAGQITWRSAQTAEEVFECARGGDSAAQAEIDEFIDEVAHGIATTIMTVDPAMVVIGGGLSRAHDQFLEPLRAAIPGHIRLPIQIPVVEARLGAEAGAHGALVHAFRRFSDGIYGMENMVTPPVRVLE